MNDAYYTQTGERPELAALEVNPPEGYIGSKILPSVPVTEKSGTVFYADVTADEAAETDRATGSGPDSTQIAGTSAAMTCTEAARRGKISPDEAKTMGGIDKADLVGSKYAKRCVMNALETAIATEILGTADGHFDAQKLMADAQTALDAVRLYEGKTALIGSTMVLKRVVQALLNDVQSSKIFARLIAGGNPAQAATGMNFNAWMNGLAMYLGVDEVLAGDNVIWNATGSTAEKFAIAKLDDGSDPLSHKWKPVLGKVFQFMPDGKNPWVIQSVADRVNVNNLYDAYLWYDVMIMNATAVYVFDGVSA
jgi:hypothetical protein